jgi:hypothetical protein
VPIDRFSELPESPGAELDHDSPREFSVRVRDQDGRLMEVTCGKGKSGYEIREVTAEGTK